MRPETAADRREYLESGLAPMSCHNCGTCVLVKKNSHAQTSVQWTSDTVRSCPEFAARVAAGEVAALIDGCERLRESIEAAVLAGEVEVPGQHD